MDEHSTATLFIEAIYTNFQYKVNLESLISVYVYTICNSEKLLLKIKLVESIEEPLFLVNLEHVNFEILNDPPYVTTYCKWPLVTLGNSVVAGLCSVARQMIKLSPIEEVRKLLGFREACLVSCSESSIWTKFCEVDMISTVKDVIVNNIKYSRDCTFVMPFDVLRFETHMKQPVRLHNVYKVARNKTGNKSIISGAPLDQPQMKHLFAEGVFQTLSDVILFLPFMVLMEIMGEQIFGKIPYTYDWLQLMLKNKSEQFEFKPCLNFDICNCDEAIFPKDIPKDSLYSSDPKRYKPQNRIFTKDADVELAMNAVVDLNIDIFNTNTVYGSDIEFNWDEVPIEANPEGGALPEKRANRKCHQLESLVKPVLKITGDKSYRIVDFCSGSGHLGIVLAILLPKCKIILVENKERSLERAKATIQKLDLQNVIVLQSNLDYFDADFDLGVSLHACGVATDLVIQMCLRKNAHFVSCPCCYGGIHNCYHLKYPRSKEFVTLNIKDYLSIAHAADQTHKDNDKSKQGFYCMDIVDTDRKLYAESAGYEVHLGKLQPTTCTPKNNLLVGICSR